MVPAPSLDVVSSPYADDLLFPWDDLELWIDNATDEFLDTISDDDVVSRTINPIPILIILNDIGILNILQQPFFLGTNTLQKRNVLDQPIFNPFITAQNDRTMWTNLFVRKKNRSNLTQKHEELKFYLALQEESFLSALENAAQQIKELFVNPEFNLNIRNIFNTIGNASVEERQLGLLVDWTRTWERRCVRAVGSIQYYERNFFLSDEEQDVIFQELDIPPSQDNSFQKAHFISDTICLGDFRVYAEEKFVKSPFATMHGGLFATIPTSFRLKTGIAGSAFPKPSTFPSFNFDELFLLAQNPQQNAQTAFDLISSLFLDSLDRISADLLEANPSDDGVGGLGIFMRTRSRLYQFIERPFAQFVLLKSFLSFEYIIPAYEKLFYVTKTDPAEFARFNLTNIIDSGNEERASEALHFIQRKAVEQIFLRAFPTLVQPGIVFRWDSAIEVAFRRLTLLAGTDFWYKGKQRILSIKVPPDIRKTLDTEKALVKAAWQTKIYLNLSHTFSDSLYDTILSLALDGTWDQHGIGSDWGASLSVRVSF
jgi:hypothetical protein